jgi:hypothetical protein
LTLSVLDQQLASRVVRAGEQGFRWLVVCGEMPAALGGPLGDETVSEPRPLDQPNDAAHADSRIRLSRAAAGPGYVVVRIHSPRVAASR